MKTKLKLYTKLIALCFASLLLSNCDGDSGPEGLQGPQGEIGAQGPQGEVGQPGNANVKQFNFGAFDHNGAEISKEIPLTSSEFETSMLYVFVSANNFWYPLPGATAAHSYRIYFRSNPTNVLCYMNRLTGTGVHSFSGMRIFAVQSSSIINAKGINSGETIKSVKANNGNVYTDEQLRQMSYVEFCKVLNISTN